MYKKMYDEYKYLPVCSAELPEACILNFHEVCYLISERAINDGKIERSTRRLCQIMCQNLAAMLKHYLAEAYFFSLFSSLLGRSPLSNSKLHVSLCGGERIFSGTWKLHDRQISHYRFRPILFSNEMRYI